MKISRLFIAIVVLLGVVVLVALIIIPKVEDLVNYADRRENRKVSEYVPPPNEVKIQIDVKNFPATVKAGKKIDVVVLEGPAGRAYPYVILHNAKLYGWAGIGPKMFLQVFILEGNVDELKKAVAEPGLIFSVQPAATKGFW